MKRLEGKERLEGMSKRSRRIALHVVLVIGALALPVIAQHFGWISGAPPLLAPGIK
jgi:hypothetical protein